MRVLWYSVWLTWHVERFWDSFPTCKTIVPVRWQWSKNSTRFAYPRSKINNEKLIGAYHLMGAPGVNHTFECHVSIPPKSIIQSLTRVYYQGPSSSGRLFSDICSIHQINDGNSRNDWVKHPKEVTTWNRHTQKNQCMLVRFAYDYWLVGEWNNVCLNHRRQT